MKSGFFDKLIDRLDRLDPQSLQVHFLRLAQERGLLEMIFQSIQEGVVVVDGAGRLNYANKAAERLLGFSLEDTRGRPVARYIRDIDWQRTLARDEAEWSRLISREIEVTYPEHRVLNFYAVPLSSDKSGDKGAVVILRDVTRDRLNEVSLVESERLKAVQLLAAGVAHEIGNPLNALTIHLQLLDRELRKLPPTQAADLGALLEVSRNEVSRLDLIITQFLRAIRPSRPKLAPVRIEELLQETLDLIKHEIRNRHIQVEIVCPSAVPVISVDRNQIKQAFFNVLKNALQAMPDGGALSIAVTGTDRDLKIRFRDSGVGIKPEDFGRLFEPYYTTKPDGSGLGLMIVQRIVQDHGGQIEVASKPDEGTSFTLSLPLDERRVRLLKDRAAETAPVSEAPTAPEQKD